MADALRSATRRSRCACAATRAPAAWCCGSRRTRSRPHPDPAARRAARPGARLPHRPRGLAAPAPRRRPAAAPGRRGQRAAVRRRDADAAQPSRPRDAPRRRRAAAAGRARRTSGRAPPPGCARRRGAPASPGSTTTPPGSAGRAGRIRLADPRARWGSCSASRRPDVLLAAGDGARRRCSTTWWRTRSPISPSSTTRRASGRWCAGSVPTTTAPRDWLRRHGAGLHRHDFSAAA